MAKQYELQTPRLWLRTPAESDVRAVGAVGKDEFPTDADALAYIQWVQNSAYENRLIYCYYVWAKQTGQCIGRVYLHSKPELHGEVEIGYGMLEDHRRHGYTTEAARAVVRFAFERAGLDFLVAIVKPTNIASLRVIENLGFTRHGTRTVPDENGESCMFDYFRLSRRDWRPLAPEEPDA